MFGLSPETWELIRQAVVAIAMVVLALLGYDKVIVQRRK